MGAKQAIIRALVFTVWWEPLQEGCVLCFKWVILAAGLTIDYEHENLCQYMKQRPPELKKKEEIHSCLYTCQAGKHTTEKVHQVIHELGKVGVF